MNERIRELSEQASEWAAANATGDWEVGPSYVDIFNKKFAELIVRECCDMLREREQHMHTRNNPISSIRSDECHIMANYIETHFGVEE